jgi:hypothetical protein
MTLAPHDHSMPAGGKLTFPLQSFVVMASHPLMSASGHTSRHYSIVFIGWEAKSVEGQAGNFQDRTARLEEQADFVREGAPDAMLAARKAGRFASPLKGAAVDSIASLWMLTYALKRPAPSGTVKEIMLRRGFTEALI